MRSGLWTIFASSKGAHVETFLQLTLDCFLPLRGKRNPSTILYRQRMRSQRASKHYQALVERQLDAAVENSLPGPVTPQPLTALLPAAESESPPTADPPAPAPPPRPPPNRLLVFDAPAPAAAAVEPAREPSPQELLPAAAPSPPAPCLATAASLAREEPPPQLPSHDNSYDSTSPPDSPEIYCSQYRLAQHEENKTAVLHDKGERQAPALRIARGRRGGRQVPDSAGRTRRRQPVILHGFIQVVLGRPALYCQLQGF